MHANHSAEVPDTNKFKCKFSESLYIYPGGLGIRIRFSFKDSDVEQICVALSGLDSRSLPIVRMDEKDCGSKIFHSLRKNYTEKSTGNLVLTS